MRSATLSGCIALAIMAFCHECVYAGEQQRSFESLYQEWHEALNANKALGEPFWRQLGPVREMNEAGLAFGVFLCEKVTDDANAGMNLYQDVQLLDEFAGVNLYYPEERTSPPQNIFAELMPQFVARFRQQWREGLYNDPSKIVAQLCQQRMSNENVASIAPAMVVGLRRYGIFGLPELIRQIKKENSKHAFAAYLIMTRHRTEYADYINHSDVQFQTKEEKLDHIAHYAEGIRPYNAGNELMSRIISALSR
jgi:hypothetical protein